MSEWQPIETAPKDGAILMFCSMHRTVFVTHWGEVEKGLYGWVGEYFCSGSATHWMPLPAPPKEPEHETIWPSEVSDAIPSQ